MVLKELLIATNNPGKMLEIRSLLGRLKVKLLTPADLDLNLTIEEDGTTYVENASRKAAAFTHASGRISLADDSGLEVAALGGEPGLLSARYAPMPHPADVDRRRYLLQRLEGKPLPWTACFRATVAITTPAGEIHTFDGSCEGMIIPEERGENGFGYDPIFLVGGVEKTMAELSLEEKNHLSHRARAIHNALPLLERIFKCE